MSELTERIEALEKIAETLEWQQPQRNQLMKKIEESTVQFIDQLDHLPAFNDIPDGGSELRKNPLREEAYSLDEVMDLYHSQIVEPGLNPASGGHLGYIPGGGVFASTAGDFLADMSNKYAGVYFASPGAVKLENYLLEWMAEMVGYPNTMLGNLASGGSIANLSAVVTARDAKGIKSADVPNAVIYCSEQMHHCLNKAFRISGLSESIIRYIPLDDHFRMRSDALKQQLDEDLQAGLTPFLIIGSAGTTDTGSIDPLDELAVIAEQHDLWFHVDAAYGGFFMLVETMRDKFKGIERSDSVVMDPHKGLFVPYGTGALLVRDGKKLMESHYYLANYMQDTLSNAEEASPADLSPELTKHFRGLRLWVPLMTNGLAPFRACLEEKYLLAQYFHEKVSSSELFEAGPEPELSVVTYRLNHPEAEIRDQLNEKLTEMIRKDGRVFISSTRIKGEVWLRCAILSFRTRKWTIDTLLEVLHTFGAELLQQSLTETDR